jgi:hypothetical protein
LEKGRVTVKKRIIVAAFTALSGTTVGLAQTQEGQQGCMNDAFRLCQDAIPDHERVFQCLASHKDLLSVGCHAVMAPSPVDKPPLKKEILRAKSAKGKTTFAKHFTKAASERDRRPLPLLPTK